MGTKNFTQLTALTSAGAVDTSADLLLIGDASAGLIKTIAPKHLIAGSTGVVNVMAHGAVGDGVANDRTAIDAAIVAAGTLAAANGKAVLYFPPGTYLVYKASSTTLTSAMLNGVTWMGHGAILDFNAGYAYGISQSITDWRVFGLHFRENLNRTFANTVTGITFTRCVFDGNTFSDITQGASSGTACGGIDLYDCIVKDVRITNNVFRDITSPDDHAYACMVGWNDASGGDNFDADATAGSYSTDDNIVISGNMVRTVSSNTTGEVHAFLFSGNGVSFTNNYMEDIKNSNATLDNTEYVYIRGGSDILVEGNTFVAKTGTSGMFLSHKGQSNKEGGVRVTNNTFRCKGSATVVHGVRCNHGYIDISDNKFIDVVATGDFVVGTDDGATPEVTVARNTFIRGKYLAAVELRGSKASIEGNRIINPVGPNSSTGTVNILRLKCSVTNTSDAAIKDNTVILDSTYTNVSSQVNVCALAGQPSCNIANVEITGNTVTGASSVTNAATLVSIVRFEDDSGGLTHTNWRIENNTDGGSWRSVNRYSSSGMNSAITRVIREHNFRGPLAVTAGVSLAEDESGVHLTNAGASSSNEHVLPAASPGMVFTFTKIANQALTIDPNGTDTISTGSAGGALTVTGVGDTVRLRCIAANAWVVEGGSGNYSIA